MKQYILFNSEDEIKKWRAEWKVLEGGFARSCSLFLAFLLPLPRCLVFGVLFFRMKLLRGTNQLQHVKDLTAQRLCRSPIASQSPRSSCSTQNYHVYPLLTETKSRTSGETGCCCLHICPVEVRQLLYSRRILWQAMEKGAGQLKRKSHALGHDTVSWLILKTSPSSRVRTAPPLL